MGKTNRDIASLVKKIDPRASYNLTSILALDIIPIRDVKTLRKLISSDMHTGNLLKVQMIGSGRGMRYFIRGKNIINYLHHYGPGIIATKNTTARARAIGTK